jgi:hypothetical protein
LASSLPTAYDIVRSGDGTLGSAGTSRAAGRSTAGGDGGKTRKGRGISQKRQQRRDKWRSVAHGAPISKEAVVGNYHGGPGTRKTCTLAGLLIAAVTAGTARADSILIQQGGVGFSFDSPPGLILAGEGFSATAFFPALGSPSLFRCLHPNTCPPGTAVNLSGVFGGGEFRGLGTGGATVNGSSFGSHAPDGGAIELRGALVFDAATLVVPNVTDRQILLSAPFVMHGFVSGFEEGSSIPLFETTVRGSGRVGLSLHAGNDPGAPGPYGLVHLGYGFEPVPEPATLLMVGSGLASVAMAGLRLRRARPSAWGGWRRPPGAGRRPEFGREVGRC